MAVIKRSGCLLLLCVCFFCAYAQQDTAGNAEVNRKAAAWVTELKLQDKTKSGKVEQAIATHLIAVRDWHNTHPGSMVPAGINPATGNMFSDLDRDVIMCSSKPKSVHDNLMEVLKTELNDEQVEMILDKYTIGKVAFTLKGYEAIVPNLTDRERTEILKNLKQAREQAIDYKNMKEISAIFEIYKTKCEQYLNNNGRSWRQMYKEYTDKIKAEKAAKAGQSKG